MTHSDTVIRWGGSVIQHGRLNNRVYIMKLAPAEAPDIIRFADDLAQKEGYTKIFVKVPESLVGIFNGDGYVSEATVPFFFSGTESAVFMARYLDPHRREICDPTLQANVLSESFGHAGERTPHVLPDGFSLMHAHAGDIRDITTLYGSVFPTYPFPITDPEFIRHAMQDSTRYYVVKKHHILAAVASCEIDSKYRNAEVTDFATGPLFRGYGFASLLLKAIETDLKREGIGLAYTICRALFGPINTVFTGAGYEYGGLLPNNTNICGGIESMNVWYRRL